MDEIHGENSFSKPSIEWPHPKILTELRGFIEICTYYRNFVKGFCQITSPLTDLKREDAFQCHEGDETISKE